ncbi:MAG: glutaredoxin family protein [Acidobacteriota bacterium]|nr:glutaredoxin family protein [Acidobacteriota bacterium]
MKAALAEAARRLPLSIQEVDISADPALTARYGHDIPVLVAGTQEVARHRATADEIVARLAPHAAP